MTKLKNRRNNIIKNSTSELILVIQNQAQNNCPHSLKSINQNSSLKTMNRTKMYSNTEYMMEISCLKGGWFLISGDAGPQAALPARSAALDCTQARLVCAGVHWRCARGLWLYVLLNGLEASAALFG